MAFTDLIASGSTAASSAFRTIAAGGSERVGIRAAASNSLPSAARAVVEISTNTGNTVTETYDELGISNKTLVLYGPLTYRVSRLATGATFVVYAEHA